MRQRPSQLVEFRRRAVHFHPGQVGYFEPLREERPNAVQVGQQALGVGISFTAEDFIAVESESVEEIFLFVRCFLNESGERGFEGLKFPRMDFEVGMKADEIRKRIHSSNLPRPTQAVEAIVVKKPFLQQ
jgi:hypothetical protein